MYTNAASAPPPTVLSTFHSLSTSLRAAQPSPLVPALISPHAPLAGPALHHPPPLTREALGSAISSVRDVLEQFKAIWEEGGEEGRTRAAGLMTNATSQAFPLLAVPPFLGSLASTSPPSASSSGPWLFPPPAKTPFGLPLTVSPPDIIERAARSLGLEVYRDTTVVDDDGGDASAGAGAAASTAPQQKDIFALGDKVFMIDLELISSSTSSTKGVSPCAHWTVAKFRTSFILSSSPSSTAADTTAVSHEPIESPTLNAYLLPPLRELLDLLGFHDESVDAEGERETVPLRAARALHEFERRMRAVLELGSVVAGGGVEGAGLVVKAETVKERGDVFAEGLEVQREVEEALLARKDEGEASPLAKTSINPYPPPYPSFLLTPPSSFSPRLASHQQYLHLRPSTATSIPSVPHLPLEIFSPASRTQEKKEEEEAVDPMNVATPSASAPWGWEAVFEPPLVVGLPNHLLAAMGGDSHGHGSWGPLLIQQARSSSSPPTQPLQVLLPSPSNATTPQAWSFAETQGPIEAIALGRVGIASAQEAAELVEWARRWAFVNEFFLGVFDTPSSVAMVEDADDGFQSETTTAATTTEDLEALLLAPPANIPITLHLVLPSSSPQATHPSLLLSFPSPSSSGGGRLGALHVDPPPLRGGSARLTVASSSPCSSEEELVSEERLKKLGQALGGWGAGLVGWFTARAGSEGGRGGGEKENGSERVAGVKREAERALDDGAARDGGEAGGDGENGEGLEGRKRARMMEI